MSTNNKAKYYIQGMHCASCEMLIKQDVMTIKGINKAEVSLSKSHIVLHADSSDSIPDTEVLNSLFDELGYTFHTQKLVEKKLAKEDIYKVLGIVALFIVTFYALERTGFFMKFAINSQSAPAAYFVFGLAAGVSSCAALVGGLLLSLSKKWNALYNNNSKKSVLPFIYFNASRLLTFAILGGLLGYLGSFISVSMEVTAFVTILISFLMLLLGLQMAGVKWLKGFSLNFVGDNSYLDKNQDIQGKYVPIIVGALTFFIPCGFTLIAQTNVLTSGSFGSGFIKLLAFSLGTLPVLAIISFSSVKFYSNPAFSKKFSLFSGVLIAFFALYTMNAQLNVLGITSLNDFSLSTSSSNTSSATLAKATGDYQVMQMEATGFDYLPRQITIKSGLKTQWNINNVDAVGCARAVYARGLYPEVIYLNQGMNTVEFTAPQPGTYKISCSMGMVSPVTVTVL